MHFMTSVEGNQLFTNHSGWLPSIREVKVPPDIEAYRTPLDCYSYGAEYMTGMGSTVAAAVMRNLYLLTETHGSVDQFVDAMEAAMPEAVRADLRKEISNRAIIVRPQDVGIMAAAALSRRSPQDGRQLLARERLESSQTQSEGLMLQMGRQLEVAGPAR